jgi:hypothetical protein
MLHPFISEQVQRLTLVRRLALMPINEEFRQVLVNGCQAWLDVNDPEKKEIAHLQMEVERHPDYDDLGVHLCTDNEDLSRRFAEEFLDPLMEQAYTMVYEALRDHPIDIPHGEEGHVHDGDQEDSQ